MIPPPRRAEAGFTLIELLISLALFGLISLILAGGLHFGLRAWDSADRRVESGLDLDPVQHLLRNLVASATALHGGADELDFTAEMPAALGARGLQDARLFLAGDALTLAWRPHIPGDTSKAPSLPEDSAVLATKIDLLEFAYLPVEGEAEHNDWQSGTGDAKTPPKLIRVTLGLPPADRRNWPALVIAPAVDRTAGLAG